MSLEDYLYLLLARIDRRPVEKLSWGLRENIREAVPMTTRLLNFS